MTEARRLQRELRCRTKHLRLLTADVKKFIAWMDTEMKKPATGERARRTARAVSDLEASNDCARRFALPTHTKTIRRELGSKADAVDSRTASTSGE